jgi:hypothetical protein
MCARSFHVLHGICPQQQSRMAANLAVAFCDLLPVDLIQYAEQSAVQARQVLTELDWVDWPAADTVLEFHELFPFPPNVLQQVASHLYQDLLDHSHMHASMSRKGNCYDNAVLESFFATLKAERVDDQRYASPAVARLDLFGYIEGFYNRSRLHSALGYLSPEQFEQRYAA